MRKYLLFVVLSIYTTTFYGNDGSSCQQAKEAKLGVDSINFGLFADIWYKYTPNRNGMLVISVPYNVISDHEFPNTGVQVYENSCSQLVDNETMMCRETGYDSQDGAILYLLSVQQGITYYFRFIGSNLSSTAFKWQLSEEELVNGWSKKTATDIEEGSFNVSHDQFWQIWYKYTAKNDDRLIVNATNDEITIYDAFGAEIISGIYKMAINCKKNVTYYIKLSQYSQSKSDVTITEREAMQGESINNPFTAITGINISNHWRICNNDFYYQYTFEKDGILEIGLTGSTFENTSLEIYQNNQSLTPLANSNSSVIIKGKRNESIIIKWAGTSTGTYYWQIKYIDQPENGTSCQFPRHAVKGTNEISLAYDHSSFYYSYTPSDNCIIKIGYDLKKSNSVSQGYHINCQVTKDCFSSQLILTWEDDSCMYFKAKANEKYTIGFSASNLIKDEKIPLNWRLSELKDTLPDFVTYSGLQPIKATEGINQAITKYGTQLFYYTGIENKIITLHVEQQKGDIMVYKNNYKNWVEYCSPYGDAYSKNYAYSAGDTLFIYCYFYFQITEFDWKMSVKNEPVPDILSVTSPMLTKPAKIDSEKALVELEVSKLTNLQQLSIKYTVTLFSQPSLFDRKFDNSNLYSLKTNFTNDVKIKIKSVNQAVEKEWTIRVTPAKDYMNDAEILSLSLGDFQNDSIEKAIISSDSVLLNVPWYNPVTQARYLNFKVSPMAKIYDDNGNNIVNGSSIGIYLSKSGIYKWKTRAENGNEKQWIVKVNFADPPAASLCENSIIARQGMNYNKFQQSDMWYNYTALADGVVSLRFFSPISGIVTSVKTSCSADNFYKPWITRNQFEVTKGSTYYFCVFQVDSFQLTVNPFNDNTDILGFSNISWSHINPIEHTIKFESLFQPFDYIVYPGTIIVSPFAKIYHDTTDISGLESFNLLSPDTFTVVAQDGIHKQDWVFSLIPQVNHLETGNEILYFVFQESEGETIIDKNKNEIQCTVKEGTDLQNLTPFFILSYRAYAFVNSEEQYSGISSHDFSNSITYIIRAENEAKRTWRVKVNSKIPDGIENDKQTFRYSVFPNPAKDVLNIKIENCMEDLTLQLYNLNGQKVMNKKITGSGMIKSFDISTIPSGTYIMRIESSGYVRMMKIVKEVSP